MTFLGNISKAFGDDSLFLNANPGTIRNLDSALINFAANQRVRKSCRKYHRKGAKSHTQFEVENGFADTEIHTPETEFLCYLSQVN